MAEQQLRDAFELMKQGEKNQAMSIVRSVLRENRQNIDAWWLMANLLDDEDKILKSLNQVLELNPEHRGARKKLAALRPDLAENLAPSDDDKKKKNAYDWSKLDRPAQPQKQNAGKSLLVQMLTIAISVFVFMGGPYLIFSLVKDNIPVEVQGPPPEEVARTHFTAAFNGNLELALEITCDSLKDEWQDGYQQIESQARSQGIRNFEFDFSKTTFNVIEQKARRTVIRMVGEIIIRADGQEISISYDDLAAMSDRPEADPNVMLIVSDGRWVVCSY